MNILVTGSNGFIGTPLTDKLKEKGHEVYSLSRSRKDDPKIFHWNPDDGTIELDESIHFDAVIHLAGEGIANKRWSESQKKKIRDSRVNGTTLLAEKVASLEHKPSVFICASAIGYFGDRGDEELTESSPPGDSYLADVCQEWENSTRVAEEAGIRVAHTRFGIVLGSGGGALQKMLTPFKMGVGGNMGSGNQYWSWIALDDVVHILIYALENDQISGPVNCVSPQPLTNREFTKVLGKVLHRPTMFPMPGFAAKLALGEMADELLLCSAKVIPQKLNQSDYTFQYSDLEEALKSMI